MTGRIKKLDEQVVHKIAAGEIIVSPRNALKELLENAIDSGATKIDVVVADGGFKLLHITDNGCGIHTEDLAILCQRFTTSKIGQYADLENCETLGFRGEALASISFISNLQVITKSASSAVATRAAFDAGNLLTTKPTAGLNGTQIVVENLFYNNPTRRDSLRASKKQEYTAILDIVTRYAIHYKGTFTCKQQGDAQPTVVPDLDTLEKLKIVFGATLASSLLPVEASSPGLGLAAKGFVSSLDSLSKNAQHVLFVNGRLIECKPLSRGIQLLYSSHMAKGNPFIYLSLEIAPENVDVNIHPTKSQVSFLHETEIVAEILDAISSCLTSQDTSRSFATQTLLTSSSLAPAVVSNSASTPQRYEHKLVRTDPRQSTLTFARATSKTAQPSIESPTKNRRQQELNSPSDDMDELPATVGTDEPEAADADASLPIPSSPSPSPSQAPPNLQSVAELKEQINDSVSIHLTQLIAEHTYVGHVDPDRALAAIQYDVRLYLADYDALARSLFYQITLINFGTFGTIHLGSGLPIAELLAIRDADAQLTADLQEMAPMLESYFKICITPEGLLTQLPLLLADYTPPISRLPQFIADLNGLNWTDEKDCIGGIARAIAALHVPNKPTDGDLRLIFDALKTRFVATRDLGEAVIEIASLPGLYKVFERC